MDSWALICDLAQKLLRANELSASTLRAGMTIPVHLYDANNVLLPTAGAIVTDRLIEQLHRRNTHKLYPKKRKPDKPVKQDTDKR